MVYKLTGKHLVNGKWIQGTDIFQSAPNTGPSFSFSNPDPGLISKAVNSASEAFPEYSNLSRKERANFLREIATEIEASGDELTKIATEETGLPDLRIIGERGRTVGQLRLFADHIDDEAFLDIRHDYAIPNRKPLPRPDLKLMQISIGPVAIFGASNFPLAFSTAGGDTASALAAGCPVIFKGHPSHPGTCEVVAQAILRAIKTKKINDGVFSLLQGDLHLTGSQLVTHEKIEAVGFTGSLAGGRALFDLCAGRARPIPFFGEMGSVNPIIFLPEAVAHRSKELTEGWASSISMGVGQFCTKPGIGVLYDSQDSDNFIIELTDQLERVEPQTMLSRNIANAFEHKCNVLAKTEGIRELLNSQIDDRKASPRLYETDDTTFLSNPGLKEEIFGPMGLIVRCSSKKNLNSIIESFQGELTFSIHFEDDEYSAVREILPLLSSKSGRIIANGFPTGVEVCDSMVHDGPYPASTNFGSTSVGTLAIRRFLRPICFQNMPDQVLPEELKKCNLIG